MLRALGRRLKRQWAGQRRERKLVLVLGTRRSGTTLLNHILCTAPGAVRGLNEVQPLTRLLEALQWCTHHFDPITADFFAGPADFDQFARSTCDRFLRHAWVANGRPETLVLKNPELSLHVERVLALWPHARLVCCVRDPRDQIASEMDVLERQRAQGMAVSMPDPVATLVGQYRHYMTPVLRAAEGAQGGRVHFVRYEDLVQWRPETVRALTDFTGLDLSRYVPDQPWDGPSGYLRRVSMRPSFSASYGQPLRQDRVGRFAVRLPPEEVRRIEADLAGFMARFAYESETDPSARGGVVADDVLEFVLMIEAGAMEAQAVLLCESIRRFSGRYAGCGIVAISSRPDRRPDAATIGQLALLDVRYLEMAIDSPCPEYEASFPVLASAAYEAQTQADCLVVLNSDTVFLAEPDLGLAGVDAAARPVDVQGICATGQDDVRQAYWQELCAVCGVSFTDLPYVRASVDGCLVKASYKGGLVVVRVERAILRRTADYFLRSVAAGLRPFAGEGVLPAGQGEVSRAGSGYRGSSQDCLSLALWGSGLSVRTLPPSHHFPLQFYEHFRADLAAGGFGPIVHMHYQHLFRDVSPLGAAVLDGPGFPSEGLAWFTSRMAGLAWPPGSGSRA